MPRPPVAEWLRPKCPPIPLLQQPPSTTKPLPQLKERERSLPVPSGRIATAGMRFQCCFSTMFNTHPMEPWR